MNVLKSNKDKRKNKVGNIMIMVRPGQVFLLLSPPHHPLNNKNPDPTPNSGEAMCSAPASPPPFSWSASAACGSLNHNTASPSGEKSGLWKEMCVQEMKFCDHLILACSKCRLNFFFLRPPQPNFWRRLNLQSFHFWDVCLLQKVLAQNYRQTLFTRKWVHFQYWNIARIANAVQCHN